MSETPWQRPHVLLLLCGERKRVSDDRRLVLLSGVHERYQPILFLNVWLVAMFSLSLKISLRVLLYSRTQRLLETNELILFCKKGEGRKESL